MAKQYHRVRFLTESHPTTSTDQPTIPSAVRQLVISHAHSSYEQLDYHISWSLFRQRFRIRRLDNRTARQGVWPHSVGWAPASCWTGFGGYSPERRKRRSDGSKYADRFSRLAKMKDKHILNGVRTCFPNIWMTHKRLCPWEALGRQRYW